MHSYDIFWHFERRHWKLADIPFEDVPPALVRPEYVTIARSAVRGESNSIAATHGCLSEPETP